ncbi:MAG: hypothetical protein OEZ22_01185 [Spirochaetia bacterium]|nr:hypothetical protein [Spirochaetia bacterium]
MKKENIKYLILTIVLIINCAGFFTRSPEDNFFFIAQDMGETKISEDKLIYYKIYINNEYVAKTPAGYFFEEKKISLYIKPGKHIFYVERWILDEPDEVYKRANNVWQMPENVYLNVGEKKAIIKTGFHHGFQRSYLDISEIES